MELSELYQELIIDHGTQPRNCCALEEASHSAEGFNPLCGDKVHVFCQIEDNVIQAVTFEGSGCAISMASASLMTEILLNKTVEEAENLFNDFKSMVTDEQAVITHDIGKLEALAGVKAYPSRVKCATLAWHTLSNALNKQTDTPTSTE